MSRGVVMADLDELQNRLRAATEPDREISADIMELFVSVDDPDAKVFYGAGRHFMSSLELTLRLANREFSGWRITFHSPRFGSQYGASLANPADGGIVAVYDKASSFQNALLDVMLTVYIKTKKEGRS